MSSLTTLLALLDKLLNLVLVWRRGVEQRDAQGERDALEKNPAGWFTAHFDGVRPPTDKAGSPDETTVDGDGKP